MSEISDLLPSTNVALLWITSLIVTVLCLFWRRRFRNRRHQNMQRQAKRVAAKIRTLPAFPQKLSYLRKINPFVFEEMLLDAFELAGHKIRRNKRYTGDGGIDGRVWINGELHLIQAKRYSGHVAIQHIREFEALLRANNCKGFFCHTGKTRDSGKELAKSGSMTLISGTRLLQLLEHGRL